MNEAIESFSISNFLRLSEPLSVKIKNLILTHTSDDYWIAETFGDKGQFIVINEKKLLDFDTQRCKEFLEINGIDYCEDDLQEIAINLVRYLLLKAYSVQKAFHHNDKKLTIGEKIIGLKNESHGNLENEYGKDNIILSAINGIGQEYITKNELEKVLLLSNEETALEYSKMVKKRKKQLLN